MSKGVKNTPVDISTLAAEQRIAYELKRSEIMRAGNIPKAPASRIPVVGQPVRYGSLSGCVVAALSADDSGDFDGRVVLSHEPRRSGRDADTQDTYSVVHWFDISPIEHAEEISPRDVDRLSITFLSHDVAAILSSNYAFGFDSDPDFQRGYVWTPEDRERFLDSVFAHRDIGKFIFVKVPYPAKTVVMDGKQRLDTLTAFYESRFPYKGMYWHNLSKWDQHVFRSCGVQSANIESQRFSRADLLQIFLNINAAGVPQSDEHLAHVRQMLEDEKSSTPLPSM